MSHDEKMTLRQIAEKYGMPYSVVCVALRAGKAKRADRVIKGRAHTNLYNEEMAAEALTSYCFAKEVEARRKARVWQEKLAEIRCILYGGGNVDKEDGGQ